MLADSQSDSSTSMVSANANKKNTSVTIVSQNLRGLKSDVRLDELFAYIVQFGILAACVQETWRSDNKSLQNGQCLLLAAGLDANAQAGKRGSQGVGIVLNASGVDAWRAGGYELHNDFGARIIAVRLLLRDIYKRDVAVFLVSAYAPVSSEPDSVWNEYYDQLDTCIQRRRQGDILVIGTDSNSSIGTMPTDRDQCIRQHGPVGQFGLNNVNVAGRRLRAYLSTNNLVAASTCFKKRNYGTWQHPRSRLMHQIDHFIVNNSSFKCVLDAGITEPILYSDHRAIKCRLRVMCRLKKRSEPRQKLLRLDYSKLNDNNVSTSFCTEVVSNLRTDNLSYSSLAAAVTKAATTLLPKQGRANPGWFRANEQTIAPLICARNAAMAGVYARRTRASTHKLQLARKALTRALSFAKSSWISGQCSLLNNDFGTKAAWDAVAKFKSGLSKTRPTSVKKMRKPDGSICQTPEENAEVFRTHFETLYGREPNFDRTVIDMIPQHDVVIGCDQIPSDNEIRAATQKLRDSGPGDSGICAQSWKCLLKSNETFDALKRVILEFWETEIVPAEWEVGLLKILPKTGDLSQPGNHRGIMLLEIAYKIVAIILHARLQPIAEGLDHETQCGFRPGRGCTDAVFTVKLALKKRHEHGLETWVLFLDLVKAFDRVPRELLWMILRKFGVLPKLVSLLESLHEHVYVKFNVDSVGHVITCIIGVKQGDILGPILFTFFMAAVMITWRITYAGPLCLFRSKRDFIMTGRSYRAYGDEFPLSDSEYADDAAILFDSRASLDDGAPRLVVHFGRFGMEVHAGNTLSKKKSKSEVLFCPKPLQLYQEPETYDNANITPVNLGEGNFIPIVFMFVYLGTILSHDCTDKLDVENRIDKAGSAFGALRDCLFASTRVNYRAKSLAFTTLILSILLYGSESWCLTEALYRQLRNFHARCVRAMCRITRRHARLHRISTADLLARLGLPAIDTCITRRQLRWAGHVSRMEYSRLPRKMLSGWVRSKRPRGCPRFTYGRTLQKSLQKARIDSTTWPILAQNRAQWRAASNMTV